MSIGCAEFEEWAVATVEDVATSAERFMQGHITRTQLASVLGQARDFLKDEALYQDRDNQTGGFEVHYYV